MSYSYLQLQYIDTINVPTCILQQLLKLTVTSTLKWGGAPSCCIHILSRTAKGTPPFSVDVRNHLNAVFPGRWIGRGGPIPRPARSPDLNPLHYFLWGYLKWLVFNTPVETAMEYLPRIVAAMILFKTYQWYTICHGGAESCKPSCLHWGWWPLIWATVVGCKMVS